MCNLDSFGEFVDEVVVIFIINNLFRIFISLIYCTFVLITIIFILYFLIRFNAFIVVMIACPRIIDLTTIIDLTLI